MLGVIIEGSSVIALVSSAKVPEGSHSQLREHGTASQPRTGGTLASRLNRFQSSQRIPDRDGYAHCPVGRGHIRGQDQIRIGSR